MFVDLDVDLVLALIGVVNGSLDCLDSLGDDCNNPDALSGALRAAKASGAALTILFGNVVGVAGEELEEELSAATDDPKTCGHPESFPLPGQKMCKSCGASELGDGTWAVL
jgi:hypothetical protein